MKFKQKIDPSDYRLFSINFLLAEGRNIKVKEDNLNTKKKERKTKYKLPWRNYKQISSLIANTKDFNNNNNG